MKRDFKMKTLARLVTIILTMITSQVAAQNANMKYAIAIHGGAGPHPQVYSAKSIQSRRDSLKQALQLGTDMLNNGDKAIDVVEKVVRFLEDDPQFNAGVGAVFNSVGGHELDASIMDGRDLSCGAVAGVSTVKNPISLARLVKDKTRHVLFAGDGAEAFAKKMGVEMVDPKYFDTERTWQRFQRIRAKLGDQGSWQKDSGLELQDVDVGSYHGTVGCVALDSEGNLAAATSTGGMTNKEFGRVGDSPIVGAGTYADNKTCAVSCTGTGEEYIRRAVAYDVSAQLRYRQTEIAAAVNEILTKRLKQGDGGIIAVDKDGNIAMQYNTADMARAAADSAGRFEFFWGESLEKSLKDSTSK